MKIGDKVFYIFQTIGKRLHMGISTVESIVFSGHTTVTIRKEREIEVYINPIGFPDDFVCAATPLHYAITGEKDIK